ncbi:udp-glycosyltransferase 84b2 [Fusarium sporotrichioides]|uniref:Udp-glycosyltransferase 84b2 n=1 Tax=Fusarium sporotrichioides TaxID=5514 RepID=A0A395RQZ6_FUSSP|nr:udp-glycosyltransferase 84b2 [Fusarium sporotrichioides]
MTTCKRLLFFTNSDYGQANVVLATAHAIGLENPDVEIQIASFQELEAGVDNASRLMQASASQQKLPIPKSFVFHRIEGISWGPATKRPGTAIFDTLELTPGFVNSAKGVATLPAVMVPWTPEEYMEIYWNTQRVYDEVNPDLTIVEPLYTHGLTFCHHRSVRWMVLSPNTIKEFAVPLQPRLAALWKYPMACSALPYPIPWSLIPTNIAFSLVAGYTLLTNTRLKHTTDILRKKVNPSIQLMTMMELGVLKPAPTNLPILVANNHDIDYPFTVIPPQLTTCGPIVRAAPHIREVDPDLAAWLSRGPTILINLGTHHKSSPDEAHEMAKALNKVLEQGEAHMSKERPLQLLWKLGRTPDKEGNIPQRDSYTNEWAPVLDTLQTYIKQDRVLLPAWTDCYDFANRVELLGIGRWGNKKAKPRWEKDELCDSVIDTIFGSESAQIQKTAKEVAVRHPEWEGRQKAAKEILDYLTCAD